MEVNNKEKKKKKVFISSKNIVLAIIINGTSIALIIAAIIHIQQGKWILPIISTITITYLLTTFYISKYIIDKNYLIMVSGFFKSKNYNINEFISIKKSNTLIAGPASGLNRLEILTKQGDTLIISPKIREEFIDEIIKINPDVDAT